MSELSSTGFKVAGNNNEMFFDDDGAGNLRVYYLAVSYTHLTLPTKRIV